MALCSLSTGRMRAPAAAAARVNTAPPETRHSLLARAMVAPCLTAASVGSSPSAPTMAAITSSAGRAAASTTACGPAAHSVPLPASMLLSSP